MRGQRKARKVGSASGAAKRARRSASSARARVRGERAATKGFGVGLQRRVPELADLARRRSRGRSASSGSSFENALGVRSRKGRGAGSRSG